MCSSDLGGEVLAWAGMRLNVGNCAYDGELPTSVLEPSEDCSVVKVTEAIYYPEFRVFAVQHHPEWQKIDMEAPQWTLNKIAELCWGGEEERERQRNLAKLMESREL